MSQNKFTIEELFNIPTAVIYNPDSYKATAKVFIDSRIVKKNSIFVAIRGKKFNGHNFVKAAVNKGATTVVVQRNKLKEFDDLDCTIVTVQNTIKTYAELAKIWRRKNQYKVVSITGSAGKTTTKEMIADILSEKYKVVRSVANNNNHIGVPLTILSANDKDEVLVLEHGTNHFNEIDFTAKIAEPNFALITNIGDSHLEYLIDREGVYKEKSALFGEALKNSGMIIINNNDEIIKANTKGIRKKVSYGFKVKADYKGKLKGYNKYGRPVIEIENGKANLKEKLPLLGAVNAKNFLSAVAVSKELGVSKKQINEAVRKFKPVKGRLDFIHNENLMLIDDTYNASPDSMKSAIELLNNISAFEKKVLIAGDMFELGDNSEQLHKLLFSEILNSSITNFYSVGKFMSALSRELIDNGFNAKHFRQRKGMMRLVKSLELNNIAILVKGSRGMKMDEFVNVIKERV